MANKDIDIFGQPAPVTDAPEADTDDSEYIIVQMTPAEGWVALMGDTRRVLGLACFALVEMIPEDPNVPTIPVRHVRPMVVTESGEIEDVASFDDFVCIVPPGVNYVDYPKYAVAAAQQNQDA